MPLEVFLKPVETLVFRSDLVAFGTFRCPATHPLYRDSGPCTHHTFVFPRTVTAIRHEEGESFVGTPNSASFYNQHQRYTRSPVSGIDASDWFVIADDVLVDILRPAREDRPFTQTHVRVDASVYLAQRQLFENAAALEPFEIEERVMHIFSTLMSVPSAEPRKRDAVEETKRLIAANPARTIAFRELARRVGCSPFDLCRAFHRQTGFTLTQFRHSLRLRMALEMLRSRVPLTDIALDLGYTSHSHFTAAFRTAFGVTPSRYRATT